MGKDNNCSQINEEQRRNLVKATQRIMGQTNISYKDIRTTSDLIKKIKDAED